MNIFNVNIPITSLTLVERVQTEFYLNDVAIVGDIEGNL